MFVNYKRFLRAVENEIIPHQKKWGLSLYNPINLAIEVTKQCPNACSFCGAVGVSPKGTTIFSKKLIVEIVNQAKILKIPLMRITGGEPGLFSDLPYLVKKATEANIEIERINTSTRLPENISHSTFIANLINAGLGNNKYVQTIISIGMGPQQEQNTELSGYSDTSLEAVVKALSEMKAEVKRRGYYETIRFQISLFNCGKAIGRSGGEDCYFYRLPQKLLKKYPNTFSNVPIKCQEFTITKKNSHLLSFVQTKSELIANKDWKNWDNCCNYLNKSWIGPIFFIRADGYMTSCMTWDNYYYPHAYYLGDFSRSSIPEGAQKANNLPHIRILKEKGIKGLIDKAIQKKILPSHVFLPEDVNESACVICQKILGNSKFYSGLYR